MLAIAEGCVEEYCDGCGDKAANEYRGPWQGESVAAEERGCCRAAEKWYDSGVNICGPELGVQGSIVEECADLE